MLQFIRHHLLLQKEPFEEGSLARGGPVLHKYFNKSFVVPGERFGEILETMQSAIQSESSEQHHETKIVGFTGTKTTWNERTFSDANELMSYFNGPESRLRRVYLITMTDSAGAMVEFDDYEPGWSAAVVVEGGTQDASKELFERLSDFVTATFQWHSWITSQRAVYLLFLAWAGLAVYGFSSQAKPSDPVHPAHLAPY